MGVILDDSAEKEFDQLEAKGAFSLADQFRKAHEVSLESLAFMPFVPAKYQALVANSPANQVMTKQHDEKAKQEQDRKEHAALVAYQQQLDRTMLRFTIDGQAIELSHGDMRKLMQERLEALEKQRRELQLNGGDPKEIKQVDKLIDAYQPAIKNFDTQPLDAQENSVKNLAEIDPEFATQAKHRSAEIAEAHLASGSLRTSFSAEVSPDGGIQASSLMPIFAKSASPAVTPPVPIATPALQKQQQNLNNTLQSAGF